MASGPKIQAFKRLKIEKPYPQTEPDKTAIQPEKAKLIRYWYL